MRTQNYTTKLADAVVVVVWLGVTYRHVDHEPSLEALEKGQLEQHCDHADRMAYGGGCRTT